MSRNYRTNIYIIAVLCAMLYSCSPKPLNEKIISLEYLEYGGDMGTTFRIAINKDSTRLFLLESGGQDSVVKTKKTAADEWEKAIDSFSLENFKKVKDGKSNAPVDGRDEVFIIRTTANNYRLVNGYFDFFHYWRIHGLTQYLRHFKNGQL